MQLSARTTQRGASGVRSRSARSTLQQPRAMFNLLGLFGKTTNKPTTMASSFHELSALNIDKKNVSFSSLQGKVCRCVVGCVWEVAQFVRVVRDRDRRAQ